MTRSEVDQTLADIGPHAEQLPLHFASNQEDAAVLESPDEVELLLRDAIGNSFGHNMGCPDCGDKAIKAYQRLLQLQPEKAFANWRYDRAKFELRQYVQANPKDKKAKGLLADMEHGNLHIQVHDGPPSEAAPAPTRP